MKTLSPKTFLFLCEAYSDYFTKNMTTQALEASIVRLAKPLVSVALSENDPGLLSRLLRVEEVVQDPQLISSIFLLACERNLLAIVKMLEGYQTAMNLLFGFINAIQKDYGDIVKHLLADIRIIRNKEILKTGFINAINNGSVRTLSVFISMGIVHSMHYPVILNAYETACVGNNVVLLGKLFSQLESDDKAIHLDALLEKIMAANNLVLFKRMAKKYASMFYLPSRAEIYKKALDRKHYAFIQWFLDHSGNFVLIRPSIEDTLQRAFFSTDQELKSLVLNSKNIEILVTFLPENNPARIMYYLCRPRMGHHVDSLLVEQIDNVAVMSAVMNTPEITGNISLACNIFVEKLLEKGAFSLLHDLVKDQAIVDRIVAHDTNHTFFFNLIKKAKFGLVRDYMNVPNVRRQMIFLLEANDPRAQPFMEHILQKNLRKFLYLWEMPQVQDYYARHADWVLPFIFAHPVSHSLREKLFMLPGIVECARQADPFIYPEYQPYITGRIFDLRTFNDCRAPENCSVLSDHDDLMAEDRENSGIILSLYALREQQAQRARLQRQSTASTGILCSRRSSANNKS